MSSRRHHASDWADLKSFTVTGNEVFCGNFSRIVPIFHQDVLILLLQTIAFILQYILMGNFVSLFLNKWLYTLMCMDFASYPFRENGNESSKAQL